MVIYASYEDYLYIIVGIVWIIFSYYNAQKKKKAKEANKPVENQKPSFLENLIDELGINTEETTPAYSDQYYEEDDLIEKPSRSTTPTEKTQNDSAKVFSYDDYYEESNYPQQTDVNVNKRSQIDYNKTTTITETKKPTKRVKKVDLRKAIIYSEILKKKYF